MKKFLLILGGVIFMSGCSVVSPMPKQTTSTQPSVITTTTSNQTLIRSYEEDITSELLVDAKDDLQYNDEVKNFGPDIMYADVTEDGQEEALVSIPSGGTVGVVAIFIYGLEEGNIKLLQRIDGYHMMAKPINGMLRIFTSDIEESEFSTVTVTTYDWNGSSFTENSIEQVPNYTSP